MVKKILSIPTSVILVDFDNFCKKDICDYDSEKLEDIFLPIMQQVLTISPKTEEIIVRLYGGWQKNNALSNKASTLLGYIENLALFPLIIDNKRIFGEITLAKALFDFPNYVFPNTYKERQVPRLKFNDIACKTNECPIKIVKKFHQKRNCALPNCTNTIQQIVSMQEQKMVDTLMACDLFTFNNNENIIDIFLISEDIDLFPPLLTIGNSKRKNIYLFLQNKQMVEEHQEFFYTNSINILKLEHRQ